MQFLVLIPLSFNYIDKSIKERNLFFRSASSNPSFVIIINFFFFFSFFPVTFLIGTNRWYKIPTTLPHSQPSASTVSTAQPLRAHLLQAPVRHLYFHRSAMTQVFSSLPPANAAQISLTSPLSQKQTGLGVRTKTQSLKKGGIKLNKINNPG